MNAPQTSTSVVSSSMVRWLPVEDAPKSGDSILLYSLKQGVVIGSWNPFAGGRTGPASFSGAWVFDHDFGDGWGTPKLNDVTHWAPLPGPPNAKSSNGQADDNQHSNT